MTEQGEGEREFHGEEQDTGRRKNAIDAILELRAALPELMAKAMAPLEAKIDMLGEEAGRANSFHSAHALRFDSLGPQKPLNGLAGKTVLVVEDESYLLRWLQKTLTLRGASVLPASSVDLAIDFVRNARIDVALVNLRLPRSSDGIELARWICRARPTTRVVVTSGLLDAPGLDSLTVARIPKPFSLEDLERVLCDAMGHGVSDLHPDELPSTLPPPGATGFENAPKTPTPTTRPDGPQAKRSEE